MLPWKTRRIKSFSKSKRFLPCYAIAQKGRVYENKMFFLQRAYCLRIGLGALGAQPQVRRYYLRSDPQLGLALPHLGA